MGSVQTGKGGLGRRRDSKRLGAGRPGQELLRPQMFQGLGAGQNPTRAFRILAGQHELAKRVQQERKAADVIKGERA